jgi:isocitrate dehydrogenase (NAD+)
VKILQIMPSNMRSKMVYSFVNLGRKKVLACHKAGIMKMGDGLFIKIASEVAKKYP